MVVKKSLAGLGTLLLIIYFMLTHAWSCIILTGYQPVITKSPLLYSTVNDVKIIRSTFLWVFPSDKATITIKNTDTVNGTFTVNFLITTTTQESTNSQNIFLQPNESGTLTIDISRETVSVNAVIIPSSKDVITQVQVPIQKCFNILGQPL